MYTSVTNQKYIEMCTLFAANKGSDLEQSDSKTLLRESGNATGTGGGLPGDCLERFEGRSAAYLSESFLSRCLVSPSPSLLKPSLGGLSAGFCAPEPLEGQLPQPPPPPPHLVSI